MRIDSQLVRCLLQAQFPEYARLSITPVVPGGHDNRTFRIGEHVAARLPSAEPYAAHIPVEYEFLPRLAESLPVRIPGPLGLGEPGCGFPWHWTLNRWIPGETGASTDIRDLEPLARDLAAFLSALHAIDTTGAPAPGDINFHRGGDLAVYGNETERLIDRLRGLIDARAATRVWESARASRWDRSPVWVHGDMAVDNLLLREGRLHAVIDFGQLAAGDPACDLTLAWTLFDERSSATFKERLHLDEDTWARARGWALWKQLLNLDRARRNDPDGMRRVRGWIAGITRTA